MHSNTSRSIHILNCLTDDDNVVGKTKTDANSAILCVHI